MNKIITTIVFTYFFVCCSGKNGLNMQNSINKQSDASNIDLKYDNDDNDDNDDANTSDVETLATKDRGFEQIDSALASYYYRLNVPNYRDAKGNGLFLNYIKTEELDDPELPIEKEFGDNCDPYDCAYTWMGGGPGSFPVPSYAQIPHHEKEAFMFYILQHCYKYGCPPSDDYIRKVLVPKCNGTINKSFLSHIEEPPPIAFSENGNICINMEEKHENDYSDGDVKTYEEEEGYNRPVVTLQKDYCKSDVMRLSKSDFTPKYPTRAHLNIFTPKELTKELRGIIEEEFENDLILYYYTDISTALQMNDKQMKEFKILRNNVEEKISIINYDFHVKNLSDKVLYGIIVPNDDYKSQQDKWLWKLKEFLTAERIYKKYKINATELPKSSRKKESFETQLLQELVIEESLIDETDWFNVQQIKSLKRNVKVPKITVALTKEMWINECKKSFSEVNLPLLPVVVNKSNNHWVEWIKIVHIKSQNIHVGISLKFDKNNNKWIVQSICLDRGDIYNKHMLVGLRFDAYNCLLADFKTSITEITFSDNQSKDIDKKINVLKQEIRSQQDSIVRLKESLLRARNANKYNKKYDVIDVNDSDFKSSEEKDSIEQHIKEFIDENENDMIGIDKCDLWLDIIVDDVIKRYDVLDFITSPIGAKRNIYIEKQFTRLWMEYVTPKFLDESQMYYWLDYTTAMQMAQKYSKSYVNKINRKFMVAIIHCELKDKNNNILYGIIICDDSEYTNKSGKYKYKLKTLMTAEQIKMEFGINKYDLPKKSRNDDKFINKLLLRRKIIKSDLNKINWNNLKLLKSQSTNNDPINKSVTITKKVMKEYCNIALERLLNTSRNKNTKNLIPIVVIDKHHNYYGIQWVLIVNIIHRNCDVGISFRYDEQTNTFVATAIYLDKGEIESKHKLIGLKFNYCKHLRPFSLRKFKFKSDRNSVVDDDDDIAIHNNDVPNNRLTQKLYQYKKAFECEQLKVDQLHQQIQQAQNMYENLKYQSDQYMLQQQMMQQQYGTQNMHQVIYPTINIQMPNPLNRHIMNPINCFGGNQIQCNYNSYNSTLSEASRNANTIHIRNRNNNNVINKSNQKAKKLKNRKSSQQNDNNIVPPYIDNGKIDDNTGDNIEDITDTLFLNK